MVLLGKKPFEFLDEPYIAKTRILGLSVGEDLVILVCVILTQCQHVMDRQTDMPTMASTGFCTGSCTDTL